MSKSGILSDWSMAKNKFNSDFKKSFLDKIEPFKVGLNFVSKKLRSPFFKAKASQMIKVVDSGPNLLGASENKWDSTIDTSSASLLDNVTDDKWETLKKTEFAARSHCLDAV